MTQKNGSAPRRIFGETESQFRELIETVDEFFYVFNSDTSELQYVSPAVERIFGRPREDFYENPSCWLSMIHPDDRPRVDLSWSRLASHEISRYDEEFRIIQPSGEVRWVWDRAYHGLDEDGQVVRISGALADVTRRKRTEEKLAFLLDASSNLNSSLDFSETLDAAVRLPVPRFADCVFVHVYREGASEVDQEVCAHSRATDLDILKQINRGFFLTCPAEVELISQLENRSATLISRSEEDWQTLRNAGFRSFLGVPLTVGERFLGKISFFRGTREPFGPEEVDVGRDFAARAALALEHATLYEGARRAIQTREDVLAIVSHDLKSPLSAIIAGSDFLVRPNLRPEQVRQAVENIRFSGKMMRRLITDLLDFARIQEGKLSLDRTTEDLNRITREATDILSTQAQEKGIPISCHLSPESIPVHCDRARMIQVLANILGNAVKFTPDMGSITVSTEIHEGVARVSVTDTGVGIAEDQIEHIFDRYWQVKERAHQGAGLGLFIAKGIVDAHGGKITVKSRIASGSTFTVELPLHAFPD